MKELDPISLIEASYRVDLDTDAWLKALAAAGEAFVGVRRGALAFLYDATAPAWVEVLRANVHGLPQEFAQSFFDQPVTTCEAEQLVGLYKMAGFITLRSGRLPLPMTIRYANMMDAGGIEDIACLNGKDPSGHGCALCVVAKTRNYTQRSIRLWRRLGAHVSAGARLRRSLDQVIAGQQEATQAAEAILTPNGRVEHAIGPAQERRSRSSLREALARIASVRSRQLAPDRGVALWDVLVAGRWSIVEHFERDGKQYYLAHKNDPELALDRALTLAEQQVLSLAELGHSNKLIAYSLGLTVSTVSTVLTRAQRKLGLRDRR